MTWIGQYAPYSDPVSASVGAGASSPLAISANYHVAIVKRESDIIFLFLTLFESLSDLHTHHLTLYLIFFSLAAQDIITIEVLQKTLEVHKNPLRPIDYSASRAAAVSAANKRAGKGRPAPAASASTTTSAAGTQGEEESAAEPAAKAAKSGETAADADAEVQLPAPTAAVAAALGSNNDAEAAAAGWSPLAPISAQLISAPQPFIVTKPASIMRGHTGYLTFARKACTRPSTASAATTTAAAGVAAKEEAAAADEKAATDA